MQDVTKYDVAIIGGGLAGLSLSIQLAKKNYSVVLFEKEKYPFHKVCGEYISMESWEFLEEVGVPLSTLDLPKIDTLHLTAPNGSAFTTRLPLGGFGISRYKIDHFLSELAKENGVQLIDEAKVENVLFHKGVFFIDFFSRKETENKRIEAIICCGAYGKRSNLDIKWRREFISKTNSGTNNYIAVKYHIKTNWPANVIGLHNFRGGYCGISRIEDDKYCLCYLTTAANLKRNSNSIPLMQEKILFRNPALKNIFLTSEFLFKTPLVISQISFSKKSLIENNMLMLGDSSGMIAPLCGNGMSMALYSSKLASASIHFFFQKQLVREEMEQEYAQRWRKMFSKRMVAGQVLQSFFGSDLLSNLFVKGFKTFPFLAKSIIEHTHGQPFKA
jgi:flavin-dependent dehydrogenase